MTQQTTQRTLQWNMERQRRHCCKGYGKEEWAPSVYILEEDFRRCNRFKTNASYYLGEADATIACRNYEKSKVRKRIKYWKTSALHINANNTKHFSTTLSTHYLNANGDFLFFRSITRPKEQHQRHQAFLNFPLQMYRKKQIIDFGTKYFGSDFYFEVTLLFKTWQNIQLCRTFRLIDRKIVHFQFTYLIFPFLFFIYIYILSLISSQCVCIDNRAVLWRFNFANCAETNIS